MESADIGYATRSMATAVRAAGCVGCPTRCDTQSRNALAGCRKGAGITPEPPGAPRTPAEAARRALARMPGVGQRPALERQVTAGRPRMKLIRIGE